MVTSQRVTVCAGVMGAGGDNIFRLLCFQKGKGHRSKHAFCKKKGPKVFLDPVGVYFLLKQCREIGSGSGVSQLPDPKPSPTSPFSADSPSVLEFPPFQQRQVSLLLPPTG